MTDSLLQALDSGISHKQVQEICCYFCKLPILYSLVFTCFRENFGRDGKFQTFPLENLL